ncbi:alcohol dehydrogenase catalytic domain-containing protein [Selenomonas sputigena]|uniref:Alcohol dehydrogenase catalytic domain-containing protein n=1 Tax=Selenomonas sputigena TaxID=69823 RepID=A0ABV3X3V4_9FIRM
MKAAVVTDVGKVEIQEIEKPVIRENEVLIQVVNAGVCGSDLHLFHGTHAFRKPPAILGHEIAGKIVEIGSKVTKYKIGDRVTVEPQVGCGECDLCRHGHVNLCGKKKVPGTPLWLGTFVEYFPAPEQTLYKLADRVSYEVGTVIEPLAVAVHALEMVREPEKDCLVILGSGTIGLLLLAVAKVYGYKKIICTDTMAFNRAMALKLGAAAVFDPVHEDVREQVGKLTAGKGADLALIAAGAPNIVDQAAACVKKTGEVGIVAMITEDIPVYTYSFVFNELRLFGSMTYETKDFAKAAALVNDGLAIEEYITQVLPFAKTQEALDILSKKKEDVIKVLVKM